MIDVQPPPSIYTHRLIDFCTSEYTKAFYNHYSGHNFWPMRESQFTERVQLLKLVFENKLPVIVHVNRSQDGTQTCIEQRNLLSLLLRNTQEMYVVPGELVGESVGELLTHVHSTHREGSESLFQLLTSPSTLQRIYNLKLDKRHVEAFEELRYLIREVPVHVVMTYHPSDIKCRAEVNSAYRTLKEA